MAIAEVNGVPYPVPGSGEANNVPLHLKNLVEALPASTVRPVQAAEDASKRVFQITPATAGAAPFQIDFNSYPNSGGGSGTRNHGTFLGYNVGRHSDGPVTAGQSSWIMGFERNFFDVDDTGEFGPEWYVEYWSPDGASVQMFRPFYCRIEGSDSNSSHNARIRLDYGSDGTGTFSIWAGISEPDGQRFVLTDTQTLFTNAPVNILAPVQILPQLPGDHEGSLIIGSPSHSWRMIAGATDRLGYFVIRDDSAGKDRFGVTTAGAVVIGDPPNVGAGGVAGPALVLGNVTTTPGSAPIACGVLYVESGALKYKGSSGTVTTVGAA